MLRATVLCCLFLTCHVMAITKVPNLEVTKIANNVYLHKSYSYIKGYGVYSANGLVVIDNNNAFMIDTPWSERDTEKLAEWIVERKYQLIGALATHSHDDNAAGLKWLNDNNVPTYALALTNAFLTKKQEEPATYSLEGESSSIANGLVEVFFPGGGHTEDNVVAWIPKYQVLFGGCLVRSITARGLGYTAEANIKAWPNSVENVIKRYPDAKYVIPGHGRVGDIQLLRHTKELTSSMIKSN